MEGRGGLIYKGYLCDIFCIFPCTFPWIVPHHCFFSSLSSITHTYHQCISKMVFDNSRCGVEFYYSTSTCGADRRTVAVVITVNVVKVIKQNLQRFGQGIQKVILETTFDHFYFSSLTLQTITFYSFWFHGDVAQTICKSKGCVRSSQDFLTYEDLHTLKWNFLVLPFMEKMGFFLRTDVHWANCEGCHQYN